MKNTNRKDMPKPWIQSVGDRPDYQPFQDDPDIPLPDSPSPGLPYTGDPPNLLPPLQDPPPSPPRPTPPLQSPIDLRK